MSGGALNYIYGRVCDIAGTIKDRSRNPLHVAFADHLLKVSTALHDLEWVLSGDKSLGDEEAAIRAVITRTEEIEAATIQAKEALENLRFVLREGE